MLTLFFNGVNIIQTQMYNKVCMASTKQKTKRLNKNTQKKFSRSAGNIIVAFKCIPRTPVDFLDYAKKFDVSPKVLIQIKRHDGHKDLGKVFIRKNSASELMEIWRDPNQESTY